MEKKLNSIFIGVTETWFDESVLGGEISIENFSVYRSDRRGRNRGGACLYVRADIPVTPLISFSNGMIEVIIVKVPIWDLIIGVIYRPPDATYDKWSKAITIMEKRYLNVKLKANFRTLYLKVI